MPPIEPSPADTQPVARPVAELPVASSRPMLAPVAPASTPPQALTAPPGLEALTRALTHRLKYVLLLGTIALLLGGAVGWIITPNRYIAQGHVQLSNRGLPGGPEEFLNYQRTQITVLKSHTLLRKVLSTPDVADLREVLSHGDLDDQVAWLQKDLIVESVLGNAEVLRLALSGRSPDDLANILNKLMEVYVEDSRAREQKNVRNQVKELERAKDEAVRDLSNLKEQLKKKEEEHGIEDPKIVVEKMNALEGRLQNLNLQLLPLQIELAKADLMAKSLKNLIDKPQLETPYESQITAQLNQDPAYPGLKDDRKAQVEKILKLLMVVPPSQQDKVLERPKKELDETDRQIALLRLNARNEVLNAKLSEATTARSAVEGGIATLSEKLTPLNTELEKLRRNKGKVVPEVAALQQKVTQAEDDVASRARGVNDARKELAGAGRASVLETAPTPTDPKLDKKIKTAGMLGLSLFALTFVSIAFAEFRTRRIYTPDDVTRGLGIPIVGSLPAMPASARRPLPLPTGIYAPEQGPLLESVDALRIVLLRAAQTDGTRVIMVTSAGGGEGKTSLACHLAASLARGWRNTLLIDADLRNPAAGLVLEQPDGPGLSGVLRGETAADDAIRATLLPRLAVLSAGTSDIQALQALAQEEVGTLIARLKEEYDFIVIDTPPVLPVPDALMIGQHADVAVLSVLRNVSRLPAVYAAQQRLVSIAIPILGAVVIGEKANAYGINPYPIQMKK